MIENDVNQPINNDPTEKRNEFIDHPLYMYKIMKKDCIKSDFKEMLLKLATNDRSDKMFLLTSNFIPKGSVPAPRLYTCIKS